MLLVRRDAVSTREVTRDEKDPLHIRVSRTVFIIQKKTIEK